MFELSEKIETLVLHVIFFNVVRIETLVLHVKKYRIFEVSEKMVRASVGKMKKKQLLFVVVRAKWKNGKKNGALMWLWGIKPTPPPMGGKAAASNQLG
jgi:hypothetical protein